jgi:hypothetical protein
LQHDYPAFAEAREHLPDILLKRGIQPEIALTVLDELTGIIECVDAEIYGPLEHTARQRLRACDEDDWPVLATALGADVRSGPRMWTFWGLW